jgi:aerobic carbon-monoxide dehydrogenase medium subunit
VKPAPFNLHRPRSVAEALALLVDGEARVLAGGQSLVPLLAIRSVNPKHLVDINRISGLDQVSVADGEVRVGALVRHADVEDHLELRRGFPLLPLVADRLAYRAVRNRGTVCGSLAHADPAGDWPLVFLAAGGCVVARSVEGQRQIVADEFFIGPFETALKGDELLVEARFANPPGWRWGFDRFSRKTPGPALAMAIVGLQVDADGIVQQARVAAGGASNGPLRVHALEELLVAVDVDRVPMLGVDASVAELHCKADVNGSAEYRRRLVATVCRRAVMSAVGASAVSLA